MVKVIVYSADYCPFCKAAKDLLTHKGVKFEEINVENDSEKRIEIAEKSGQKTIPQIFIDDKPIGGFNELKELEQSGELDKLLLNA